jgi:hypothetical protein
MPYQLQSLNSPSHQHLHLDARDLRLRIEKLLDADAPRYRRLWMYFRNPMLPPNVTVEAQGSDRPYRLAQEWGLPSRITGIANPNELGSGDAIDGVARKEIVIENDIGWRVETMVDFLFGRPIEIRSAAPDPARRATIETILRHVLARHGGVTFFQQLALLGAVYGFVDLLVKFEAHPADFPTSAPTSDLTNHSTNELSSDAAGASDTDARDSACDVADVARALPPRAESAPGAAPQAASLASPPPAALRDLDVSTDPGASRSSSPDASLSRIARTIRLEIVEPARALPLLNPIDWREVIAYAQCYQLPGDAQAANSSARAGKRSWVERLFSGLAPARRLARALDSDDTTLVTEILTASGWQRYEDERLVSEGANSLGILPLVHIQNTAVPFEYSGASDVEPLLPIQDELNTRLCDRANRITMQSFKMYLGKGIENFTSLPVAPGRMWMTDNENAQIVEFGGDAASPSEDRHVAELREAMDKTSGVTPIAAGIVRNRIGQLTSAAALRVTMMALLARTQRKQITYGGGIARICELALAWLDRAGLFPTTPDERQIEIHWPKPTALCE